MKTQLSDAELVALAQQGRFEAFDELTTRHERRIYRLAMHVLRQNEDAEEAVQSAFLKAVENIGNYRGDAAFLSWLIRIAVNESLKILQTRKRSAASPLDGAEWRETAPAPHPEYIARWRVDPAIAADRAETRRLLASALWDLPESQRIAFALRDIEGFSTRETAEALGVSEANVKIRLLRARLALRETLTRELGDEATRRQPHRHSGDARSGAVRAATE